MDIWDSDAWVLSEGLELVSGHAIDLTAYPSAPGPPAPPDVTARLPRVELAKAKASLRYRIESGHA